MQQNPALLSALLAIAAAPLWGADWSLRATDQTFDRAALDARLRGQTLTFFDDGRSEFYEDGRYTYTYANDGGTGYGYFEVQADSSVCIEFVTGFSRCDAYVLVGQGRLTVITEDGDRFPTRP